MSWCAQVGRLGKKVGKFKKGCRLDDNGDQILEVQLKNSLILEFGGAAQDGGKEGKKQVEK